MVWTRDSGAGASDAVTSIRAMLAAGWNDLTVDYNQVNGGRDLRVQIQGLTFPPPWRSRATGCGPSSRPTIGSCSASTTPTTRSRTTEA